MKCPKCECPKCGGSGEIIKFEEPGTTTTAWEDYEKAIAAAWEDYEKAIAPAEEDYGKAIAPAEEDYGKAVVTAGATVLTCPSCGGYGYVTDDKGG